MVLMVHMLSPCDHPYDHDHADHRESDSPCRSTPCHGENLRNSYREDMLECPGRFPQCKKNPINPPGRTAAAKLLVTA